MKNLSLVTNTAPIDAPLPNKPFVGLRPFEMDDSSIFFGRQEQAVELMQRLHQHRFVGIVGSSGCGKSSLIRAGLIPKLRAGFLVGDRFAWCVTTMRPGDAPLHNLAIELLKTAADKPDYQLGEEEVGDFVEKMRINCAQAVVERLVSSVIAKDANLLVLIDQFEEIFPFRNQEDAPDQRDEADDFTALMLALAEQRELPIYVVMTMRSEFLGSCDQFFGLPEALNLSQYLVPRLTRQQRRQAIEGPVRAFGQALTPRLLDRVLNDVGDQADQLPVMQHAMMRTWENWKVDGAGPLDLPHYKAVGTIKDALSLDANRALEELSADEVKVAERMFQALVDVQEGTRRPKHLNALAQITGASPATLSSIMQRFRDEQRSFLVVTPGKVPGDPRIDISHESLIRQWDKLKNWIEDEAVSRKQYLDLVQAAEERRTINADWWTGTKLDSAREWWDKRQPNEIWASRYAPGFTEAKGFLAESLAWRKKKESDKERQRQIETELEQATRRMKKLRRVQLVSFLMAGMLLLALVSLVFAFNQKSKAEYAQAVASKNALAANDEKRKAKYAEEDARKQEQEALKQKNRAEKNAELANLNLSKAEQESRKARDAERKTARLTKLYADEQIAEAKKDKEIANNQRDNAEKDKKMVSEQKEKNRELLYIANMNLAQNAFEEGNNSRVEYLLKDAVLKTDESESDLQSFPWYELWHRKQSSFVMKGGAGKVWGIAHTRFGGEHGMIATAHENKVAILWDGSTHKKLVTLSGHEDNVYAVAFSPDGKWVATSGEDDTLRLWQTTDQETIETSSPSRNQGGGRAGVKPKFSLKHKEMGKNLYAVTFSPGKGEFLVSAGEDGKVWIWDTTSLGESKEPIKLEPLTDKSDDKIPIWSLAFSPDGKTLVTGSGNIEKGMVKLWDVSTHTMYKEFKEHKKVVTAIRYSPDGKYLVTASDDGTVRVWDAKTLIQVDQEPLIKQPDGIRALDFSDDGKILVTADQGGMVKKWEFPSGKELLNHGWYGSTVNAVVVLPDSSIASGSHDGLVRLWNSDNVQGESRTLKSDSESKKGHSGSVRELVFSPDGKLLVSGSNDNTVRIWDADTGQLKDTIDASQHGHIKPVGSVHFSPDGKMFASGSEDGTVKLWDAKNYDLLSTFNGHEKSKVNTVAFSMDSKMLASAGTDKKVILWNIATRKQQGVALMHNEAISSVQFSPTNSNLLATGCDDGTVSVWDVSTGTKLKYDAHPGNIAFTVSFSSDGKTIASAGGDGRVKIWDAINPEVTLRSPSEKYFTGATSAIFAPGNDGTLATQSDDGWLKLLDTRTWEELLTLKGRSSGFNFIAFSRVGRKLATANKDGSITIWYAATEEEVEKQLPKVK